MDIVTFKVVAFIAIFLTGLGGGLLSRVLSGSARSELLFSLGNALAGGVFLGAGLIHMLPDAQEGFKALVGDSDYPWFALTCAAGFLVILFLEKVLLRQHHDTVVPSAEGPSRRMLYPYILMLILSIHSIITGIALGTEKRIVQALVILIAVLAHKGTAAFALGVSMLRSAMERRRFFPLICFFSFMTPFGVVLGYGFSALLSGTASQAFEAVFDALAAGTFLYIALLDILEEEFGQHKHLWVKFALVLTGLGIMALVAIWT